MRALKTRSKIFLGLAVLYSANLFFTLTIAHAEQPVSASNSKRCVEYFVRDGKSFCNETMTQGSINLQPAAQAARIAPFFDNRAWVLNWWNQNKAHPMLEYGLKHEPVGHWTELVTTQFFPGLNKKATPEQFMATFINEIKQRGFKPEVHIIKNQPEDITFEFIIKNHPVENQHELQRIWAGNNGIYVIHYASRPTMTTAHRTQWIELLNKAETLR